jgi:hypothetical protein
MCLARRNGLPDPTPRRDEMSDREKAYDHRAEVPGSASSEEKPPSTEHRDTAYGNAGERNELTPDERGRGRGPRTHDDTKFTRKDGE